jgi:hypothetical protein
MKQRDSSASTLRAPLLRVSRWHYVYVVALAVQLLAYDAFHLITLDIVLKRWAIIVAVLIVTAIVWYNAKGQKTNDTIYSRLTWLLLITDIAAASYSVYLQRGMASRAVLLFIIPIVSAAILAKRSSILLTAVLSTAAYIGTTVAYFVIHFNEGYKIELYGEVGFYSTMFFVVAGLLWATVKPNKSR